MSEQDSPNTAPNTAPDSLFDFPCAFPIKVMGERRDDFAQTIVAAVAPLTGPLSADQVEIRSSRTAKYLSLTLIVQAQSRAQLDEIYRTLTSHPMVKLVL